MSFMCVQGGGDFHSHFFFFFFGGNQFGVADKLCIYKNETNQNQQLTAKPVVLKLKVTGLII